MDTSQPPPVIDPAVLSLILHTYFQTDTLALQHWEMRPLTYGQVVGTTAGLFHLSGKALVAGESCPWTMVVKLIAATSDEDTASEWYYGYREALVYQSLLLRSMTGLLSAPRCYGVTPGADSKTWLWLENIVSDEPPLWTIDYYEHAAFGLGECGALLQPQLAHIRDAPLTYSFAASWCNNWLPWYDPAADDSVWAEPAVQRFVSGRQRQHVLQLREEAGALIEHYHQLPQTFCHHDTHRLNLLVQHTPKPFARVVAIDWALAGPGPIGADMGDLVSGSLLNFCFDMQQAELLEQRAMARYLDGLHAAQWQGDPKQVEAGYLLQTVLRFETLVPGWLAIWLDEKATEATQRRYNLSEQQIAETWVALLDFVIERRERLASLLSAL